MSGFMRRISPARASQMCSAEVLSRREILSASSLPAVGTGNDPERAIVGQRIIKVEAEGDHALQNWNRRLHMDRAVFHGPWSVAGQVLLLLNGDGQILVERDFPICIGCFIEKDGPNGVHAGRQ